VCGIAGFVGGGDRANLLSMGQALAHRGPDGEGVYSNPDQAVNLIHRRLSIIDIEGGSQPMWNEDGTVCVIFNGEIYNHPELRRQLAADGHVFASDHSDTEVLVHGYEQWGENLPLALNGMFAFAIYDVARRRIFIARDRFGKKPLYYSTAPDCFVFASELTALLCHPQVDPVIDSSALNKYFAYGFIPAPLSLYRNVSKLPGGHMLTYDIATRKASIRRYWQFEVEPTEQIPPDPIEAWGEELLPLLRTAVDRRLMSDVPLGIFLSGGIDSSAVLALAAECVPANQLKTFSIGFNEPSFDESPFAREVAELFGTEHNERILSIDQARGILAEVLGGLDEPMGDPSILPTYLLSQFARERVTVALGGDGGDELFAGYDPFKALRIAEWYDKVVPRPVHGAVRAIANRLPRSDKNMSLDFKIRRGLRGMSYPASARNPAWLGALEPGELEDLFGHPTSVDELYSEAIDAWDQSQQPDIVDRTLEFYSRFYLQDDILTKVDRASMMVSLEVRAPFLDNDVVEFARRIPSRFKYHDGETKYLLKRAVGRVLPEKIIYRKKKGFGIPLNRWLKDMEDADLGETVPSANLDWVSQCWQEHNSGRADHRLFLWCWIVLQHHLRAVH